VIDWAFVCDKPVAAAEFVAVEHNELSVAGIFVHYSVAGSQSEKPSGFGSHGIDSFVPAENTDLRLHPEMIDTQFDLPFFH
jgi:hypothetical protein